jgi:hypothetical protein
LLVPFARVARQAPELLALRVEDLEAHEDLDLAVALEVVEGHGGALGGAEGVAVAPGIADPFDGPVGLEGDEVAARVAGDDLGEAVVIDIAEGGIDKCIDLGGERELLGAGVAREDVHRGGRDEPGARIRKGVDRGDEDVGDVA